MSRFQRHDLWTSIVANSAWLLVGRMISLATGFALAIVYARGFGPELYGRFSYLFAFSSLVLPFYTVGIFNIILREYSAHRDSIPTVARTCLVARLVAGIAFCAVGILIFTLISDVRDDQIMIALILISSIWNANEVYQKWFEFSGTNKPLVITRTGVLLGFAAVKSSVVWLTASLPLLVVVCAIETIAINLTGRELFRRFVPDYRVGVFDSTLFRSIFRQSRFLLLSSISAVIYLKTDILMLEWMQTTAIVGIYASAVRISEVWYVVPQIIATAMYPYLLDISRSGNRAEYSRMLRLLFAVMFWLGIGVVLLMFAFGQWIIDLAFGAGYSEAGAIVRIHIVACVFVYLRTLLSQWLIIEQFAEFSLFSQLSGAAVNVVLNLMWIPDYGAAGAAYATVFSFAFSTFICLLFTERTRPVARLMLSAPVVPLSYLSTLISRSER